MTRHLASLGLLSLVALAAASAAFEAACYTGSATDLNRAPPDPTTDSNPDDPAAHRDAGHSPAKKATGLPCDVAAVLANACSDCHGATPSGGAKNRLVTYADLSAPTRNDPNETVAAQALGRMKSATRPMPPTGQLEAATIAVFEKWVAAGLPKGTCGDAPNSGNDPLTGDDDDDGGPPPDDGQDAGPDADPPPVSVCTSGVMTSTDDPASDQMNPGMSCLECHATSNGPPFAIAGTVFPTLHEPDSCKGVMTGATVLIIDHAAKIHSLPVNASGNFLFDDDLTLPYYAMIVDPNGNVRAMNTPQNDGNCNGCHTEWGKKGATGRVRMP
jgi:hypothetical protein